MLLVTFNSLPAAALANLQLFGQLQIRDGANGTRWSTIYTDGGGNYGLAYQPTILEPLVTLLVVPAPLADELPVGVIDADPLLWLPLSDAAQAEAELPP